MCSVRDLYEPNRHLDRVTHSDRQTIIDSLKPKDILLQATRGLEFLHRNRRVHRNVRPTSFLIKRINEKFMIKITDFRLSRVLTEDSATHSGTKAPGGWIAPESYKGATLDFSSDVFVLGCVFFYVMSTHHEHPFGKNEKGEREKNIPKGKLKWQLDQENYEAIKAVPLISKMIKGDAKKRITLEQIF